MLPTRNARLFALSLAFVTACSESKPTTDKATPETASTAATAAPTSTAETTAAATATAVATGATAPEPSATAAKSGAPTGTAAATAGATATASAKPDVEGEQRKGPSFTAYLAAKPSYKKGQPATVTAIVNAIGEYHVNQEYPYKFKMGTAPAGVSYPEAIVRAVSRTEKRASMTIPFTPSAAGTATISGELSLSVCTDSNCVIEKAQLSVNAKIEE